MSYGSCQCKPVFCPATQSPAWGSSVPMPQSLERPGEGADRPRPEPASTADGPAIRSILYVAPVAALLVGVSAALADSTPSIGEILTTVIVPTVVGVFV